MKNGGARNFQLIRFILCLECCIRHDITPGAKLSFEDHWLKQSAGSPFKYLFNAEGWMQAGRFNHGFLWPGNASGAPPPPLFYCIELQCKNLKGQGSDPDGPPFYKTCSYLQGSLVLSLFSSQSKAMIGLTVCVRPMMNVFTGTGSRDTAFTVSARVRCWAVWLKAEGTRGRGEKSK